MQSCQSVHSSQIQVLELDEDSIRIVLSEQCCLLFMSPAYIQVQPQTILFVWFDSLCPSQQLWSCSPNHIFFPEQA